MPGASAALWRSSSQATISAGGQRDRAEIGGQGEPAQPGPCAAGRATSAQAERRQQLGRARRRAASRRRRSSGRRRRRCRATPRRRASARAACRRPPARCLPLLLRQLLDRVQRPVAGVVALGGEGRRAAASAASARWSWPTMSGQSASPIERSEVIALLTLRLSAACAAGSRVWISARCGATRRSQSSSAPARPRCAGPAGAAPSAPGRSRRRRAG